MRVYSFPRGGLIFSDPSAPPKGTAVKAFLPSISVISMGDEKRRVYPVITVGEIVREGMLIGRAAGPGAVNIHSTVPGRVTRKTSWKDRDGYVNEAMIIKLEGAFDKLGRREEFFPWTGLSGYDLQRIISDYGIVETENLERPLSDMITGARRGSEKLTLVIRCVFDDPWLVADYALCKERLSAVIQGASIVANACFKVAQILIAVSHPEKELGQTLLAEAGKLNIPSAMVLTGCRYPQRSRRELELALRKYEKKENLNLGSFLILGPAVLVAAYDAVAHKKPVLERYVAVGGGAVKRPAIMKVRIGTRISELVEQCGGFREKPHRIITGSPLSGKEVMYIDEPVGKTCYAIVAMSKSQAAFHDQQPCINCYQCRAVCPVGLDPQNIHKRIRAFEIDNAETTGCYGCGCCKLVCPSSLPLLKTSYVDDEASSA
ncbi:MAG: SLBB domain-containing protein [Treponema sp.]|nr:SLBB domain-containing protein [Treponema sp.]